MYKSRSCRKLRKMSIMSTSKGERSTPFRIIEPTSHSWMEMESDFIKFYYRILKEKWQDDSIMVVVDTLSKATHLIPVLSTFCNSTNCQYFYEGNFRLYEVSNMVVLDRDAKFRSKFWKAIFRGIGT